MDTVTILITALALICGAIVLIKIIASPVKIIFKLLLNALSGFLILLLVDIVGGFFDFSLALSLPNVLIAGCFGIPGTLLLILVHLL